MSIDQNFEIKSLDVLAEYLQASSRRRTRQQLAKLFFENVLYRNVTQWNRVVRLCEALTIVGWGIWNRSRPYTDSIIQAWARQKDEPGDAREAAAASEMKSTSHAPPA